LTTYISQGSAATDLKGGRGSFNLTFLRGYVLHLTKQKYQNWSTFAEVLAKIKVPSFFWVY